MYVSLNKRKFGREGSQMRVIATAFILLSFITQSQQQQRLIVGGNEVEEGRYPYTVALVNSGGGQFCGGSLIAPEYVLSAGHCGFLANRVQIGRHNLREPEVYEDIVIEFIRYHPDYDGENNRYDVMLMKLAEPSSYTPIVLDDGTQDLSAGEDVTVMGWGTTCSGGRRSDVLLEVEIDVVSNTRCNEQYPNLIFDEMVCAARKGKDSCQGDSGGPLIVKGNNVTADVQVGIVSWGNGCAQEEFPGVYTRISSVKAFTDSIMTLKISQIDKLKFRAIRLFKSKIEPIDFGNIDMLT